METNIFDDMSFFDKKKIMSLQTVSGPNFLLGISTDGGNYPLFCFVFSILKDGIQNILLTKQYTDEFYFKEDIGKLIDLFHPKIFSDNYDLENFHERI